MSFEMQKAVAKDVNSIVDLVESVYRGDSSMKGWTTEAHLLGGQRVDQQMVNDMIAKPNAALLVYGSPERVLACVFLEREASGVHLGMLSVSTSLQGQKIGQKVLEFCETFIQKEWGEKELHIEVLWQRTELIAWYERRGFRKTGKTKPFPNDPRYGLPKVSDLYFFEMIKRVTP